MCLILQKLTCCNSKPALNPRFSIFFFFISLFFLHKKLKHFITLTPTSQPVISQLRVFLCVPTYPEKLLSSRVKTARPRFDFLTFGFHSNNLNVSVHPQTKKNNSVCDVHPAPVPA